MENKPLSEEAATSNDRVQNTKSPPVPPSERLTEEFITDNAAATSELLKLRAAYAAAIHPRRVQPLSRRTRKHLQQTYYPTAPTENNTSDNTSNVPKSLVKRETRKRVTVDEDGFRLPPKKQFNGEPFLSSPAPISNSSAPPITLSNASEEIEFDTEQAAAAVAPRVKIPPFFIQPNPDWTDLMVFAHSLAPHASNDEAHFWLNGYVNKQNCRIWSEANPQVYVETPLHPEKLTVWCALWAGGILLQKR
ncbi:uncharacterized protein TNCV_4272251 [Trichonephila clavipes]|nr:uncharacterized protein TNCV_4272251 [Trichonephila clavipes]